MSSGPLSRGLAGLGLFVALFASGPGATQVNVTTYHYDNLRTGWNPNETVLTQSNLSSSGFGLLKAIALDDQVDAQPLLVANETIAGGQHNVVYVATENDSIYAIDAQSGQVLLETSLGTPVSSSQIPAGCHNNGPHIGIVSTPVIDLSSGTLYAIAYTWESGAPVYRIHALSLTTLADTTTPVEISASAQLDSGTTYQFNPVVQRQRVSLLLASGNVYAGFGSFCDLEANLTRGWVLGWQTGTLAPLSGNKLVDARSSSPNDFFLSSVWMSGYGLASDRAGSVYFTTGNTDKSGKAFNKVTNIAESAAKMSSDLSTVQGLFTPSNHKILDRGDKDFGSGGLMLLPQQSGTYANLAVAAGKFGTLYLLDADNLSHLLDSETIGSCWCGPSYFTGSDGVGRVVSSGGQLVGIWTVQDTATPKLALQTSYYKIPDGQYPGFFTSVSSNGTTQGSAIVWAVSRPTNADPAYVYLYAIDPDNGTRLYRGLAGQWQNFGGNSNIVPVVANGHVYVASNQTLSIFGTGAKGGAVLPKVRHSDMRVALASGEHEIYGIVEAIKGHVILIRNRNGDIVRLDSTDAEQAHRFAPPATGDGLLARGTFEKSGQFEADTVLHAFSDPAVWPKDR